MTAGKPQNCTKSGTTKYFEGCFKKENDGYVLTSISPAVGQSLKVFFAEYLYLHKKATPSELLLPVLREVLKTETNPLDFLKQLTCFNTYVKQQDINKLDNSVIDSFLNSLGKLGSLSSELCAELVQTLYPRLSPQVQNYFLQKPEIVSLLATLEVNPPTENALNLYNNEAEKPLQKAPTDLFFNQEANKLDVIECENSKPALDPSKMYYSYQAIPLGREEDRIDLEVCCARHKGKEEIGQPKSMDEDFVLAKGVTVTVKGQTVSVPVTAVFDGGGGHALAEYGERCFAETFQKELQALVNASQELTPNMVLIALRSAEHQLFEKSIMSDGTAVLGDAYDNVYDKHCTLQERVHLHPDVTKNWEAFKQIVDNSPLRTLSLTPLKIHQKFLEGDNNLPQDLKIQVGKRTFDLSIHKDAEDLEALYELFRGNLQTGAGVGQITVNSNMSAYIIHDGEVVCVNYNRGDAFAYFADDNKWTPVSEVGSSTMKATSSMIVMSEGTINQVCDGHREKLTHAQMEKWDKDHVHEPLTEYVTNTTQASVQFGGGDDVCVVGARVKKLVSNLDSEQATTYLQNAQVGSFLLRPSTSFKNGLAVSKKDETGKVYHYRAIPTEDGKFNFGKLKSPNEDLILDVNGIIDYFGGKSNLLSPPSAQKLAQKADLHSPLSLKQPTQPEITPQKTSGEKNLVLNLSGEEAEARLIGAPTGSFLLRPSSNKKELVVSRKDETSEVFHYKAYPTEDGKFRFYKVGMFKTRDKDLILDVNGIIDYFGGNAKLITTEKDEFTRLKNYTNEIELLKGIQWEQSANGYVTQFFDDYQQFNTTRNNLGNKLKLHASQITTLNDGKRGKRILIGENDIKRALNALEASKLLNEFEQNMLKTEKATGLYDTLKKRVSGLSSLKRDVLFTIAYDEERRCVLTIDMRFSHLLPVTSYISDDDLQFILATLEKAKKEGVF